MKNLILISCFFTTGLLIKAQQQELIENTWYLEKISDEGGTYYPPNSGEFDEITLNFFMEGEIGYFLTGVCANIEADVTSLSDNQIYIDNYTCCGEDSCTEPNNVDFENNYSDFFRWEVNLSYLITENTDGSLTLFLGNSIFSEAYFRNQKLSTSEVLGQNQENFQLVFHNNELIITSSKSTAESVSIYNLTGKMVLTTEVSLLQKINMVGLPNGIYIVKIIDKNGKSHIKKIIKR